MSAVCIKSSIPTLQPMPENFDAKLPLIIGLKNNLAFFTERRKLKISHSLLLFYNVKM